MASVKRFISIRLKLKVNESKSAVARPVARKFLGFSFTAGRKPKRRIAPKALERFKTRIRELTRRTRGIGFREMVRQLKVYLRGWQGYYGFCQTPSVLDALNEWIRRRLRCVIWKHWKTCRKRREELLKRGVGYILARNTAGSRQGPWALSRTLALNVAFPEEFFAASGLPTLAVRPAA